MCNLLNINQCLLYASEYYNSLNFDVLLTVHHILINSVINQLDAQNFCFTISLYTFRAHVLIIRRSKLHYTASGIITPIGGSPVLRCREEPVRSQTVHETPTYRFDDTRSCAMQIWPPDDEHMCSKHVEAWNKLIVKQRFCESSWLFAEIKSLNVLTIISLWYMRHVSAIIMRCYENIKKWKLLGIRQNLIREIKKIHNI